MKKKLVKRVKKALKRSHKRRKDPLHVPSEKLVVYYKGKEAVLINKALLDQQNAWDRLEEIKELHARRLMNEDVLQMLVDSDSPGPSIDIIVKKWHELQFKLQDAWGFERNANYHRFWDIPACNCPKLDNADGYPYGHYTISGNCKLHGRHLKR